MPVKHTMRADGFGEVETVTLGPSKAIRKMCRECYGFEVGWNKMVEECPSVSCPLYPFRFGKDPGRGTSDRQKDAARRNIAHYRGRLPQKTTRAGVGGEAWHEDSPKMDDHGPVNS